MNKYLGLMLFGIESMDLNLSSNPKILSYIKRINKINISEFFDKNRTRNVGLLYELVKETGSVKKIFFFVFCFFFFVFCFLFFVF
jgi:hypothetical protein